MTQGTGALARPLVVSDAAQLHLPMLMMLGALALVIAIAAPRRTLSRSGGWLLLSVYLLFVVLVLLR